MCTVYDWPAGLGFSDIHPLACLKGKMITEVAVRTGKFVLKLDNGKVLTVAVEQGTAMDLDGKPQNWLTMLLDKQTVLRMPFLTF